MAITNASRLADFGTEIGGPEGGIPAIEIDENQNVGIGTTNPTTKLQVGGVLGFGPGNNVRIGDNTTAPDILTSGYDNIFMGVGAGNSAIFSRYNNFFGFKAGHRNDGEHNNFLGSYAGFNNTGGFSNNFIGKYSGASWDAPGTGRSNNFLGRSTGSVITTGSYNNFFGSYAGSYNTTGSHNNFFGTYSGISNTTGSHNIAIGQRSGQNATTASNNISLGHESGKLNISGNKNVFLGSYTGVTTSASYKVIIGHGFGITRRFDSPDAVTDLSTPGGKDYQLAIGVRTDGNAFSSKYWLVGNENFDVGIGTTSPTQKLHVQGNLQISENAYFGGTVGSQLEVTNVGQDIIRPNGRLLLRSSGASNQSPTIELKNNAGLEIYGGSSSNGVTISGGRYDGGVGGGNVKITQGDLLVGTSSSTGTASQTLQVTGGAYVSGNLGIGTTNPISKLDVSGNYTQTIQAVGALDIDCSLGNYFTKTINGNSTFTFSSVPSSRAYSFTLELTHTSGTVTWPTEVKWPADTAPTLTTGKTHLFIFVTDDGGTRWRGAALVDYVN